VRSSLKWRKKITKTHIFGVQGRSRSSMLVPPESSSAVLVMIYSMSVSICNRSIAKLIDSSRNRAFWRRHPNLMHSYGGFLEPSGSNLTPLKSMFNPEHSHTNCPSLLRMVSAQFTLKMCIAAWNCEKFTKNPYFGGSRSIKVTDVGTTGKIASSTSYDKQQVCVYLQPFSR